jgi:hypothetical protein
MVQQGAFEGVLILMVEQLMQSTSEICPEG